MSDGRRQHRSTTSGAASSVEAADPQVVPRKAGLFGAQRMEAVNAERQEVAKSLRQRLSIQRKAEDGSQAADATIPKGTGQPLSSTVRKKIEPKLGADLGDVRVHTGGESAQAATQLGARAFTKGSDVHFGAGEFAPGTKEGDRLLVHELTHVVQGQKAGIQRKEADAATPAPAEEPGGGGDHAGHEVSQPGEPAEQEADAVADKVTDELHAAGGDKGKNDKKSANKDPAKGKDKDQNAGAGGAQGKEAAHGQQHASAAAQAGGAGETAAGAPAHAGSSGQAEGAAPIGAQLSGTVGRKIHLSPRENAPSFVAAGNKIFRAKKKPPAATTTTATPTTTPPATTAAPAAPAAAADPDLTLAQIQDEIVKALKLVGNSYTPAEVGCLAAQWAPTGKLKQSQVTAQTAAANLESQLLTAWRAKAGDEGFVKGFCAQDPIAMRNLNQVDNANDAYFDGGAAALNTHKTGFFGALATKLSAGGVKRTNCFSPHFNDAAGPFKFKGMKVTSHVPQFLQRSISVTDFFKYSCNKDQVEKEALADYNNQRGTKHTLAKFRALKCHDDVVKAYFDSKANDGAWIQSIAQGNLTFKANWWTPNQLKVQGGEVGFSQLMTLIALEPQWFAEGAIFITVDTKKIPAGVLEAKKPTCFDGMGSAMWVPREQAGETFGVTGGGIQEMLCQGISAGDVVKWQPKIPSGDLQAAIKKMDDEIKTTEPGASAVNQLDRAQGNPAAQSALHQQAQNTGPGGKKLANLNQSINDRTQEERASPTANPGATKSVGGVASGKPTLRT